MKIVEAILAEVGSVHDGSFGNACNLIELASRCGASAVKFQTHIAEHETLSCAPSPYYFKDESRVDYFNRTAFSLKQWKALANFCHKRSVDFVSSPFSIEAVDLLEQTAIDGYKVASGEVNNLPLLERIAETRKPVFLSSGMSSWAELDKAVHILKDRPLVIMQCSSRYPCLPAKVGINIVDAMKRRYDGHSIGFSDHTLNNAAAVLAIGAGAIAIEKHITFSTWMYGSDAKFGYEPDKFMAYVRDLKDAWTIMSHRVQKTTEDYEEMKETFEKSIVTKRNLDEGHVLTMNDLAFKKPGTGIKADQYVSVLGGKLNKSLPCDHILKLEDFCE